MLVITNGRVLVDPTMNVENMDAFIEQLKENIENLFGEEIEFKKVEKPFLMYTIPEGLQWKKLIDSAPSETKLEVMGIGKDDEVKMPYFSHKNVKHIYDIEELKTIADRMCDSLADISKLESEKKAMSKTYGDQINALNEELKEEANQHRLGYELQDKKVFVILNFKEKMKYFHQANNGELVASENMTDKDQRTLFDIKGYDPELFKEEDVTGFEFDVLEDDSENTGGGEENNGGEDFLKNKENSNNPDDKATSMEEV